ncbi:hypothetical protein NH44784_047241 [Achromobacter xylosoxidans NH44784-1996]|nr:hypothetical protein NH44784_047241 [Achromobacter xylosoxidans NH44784-1996]
MGAQRTARQRRHGILPAGCRRTMRGGSDSRLEGVRRQGPLAGASSGLAGRHGLFPGPLS